MDMELRGFLNPPDGDFSYHYRHQVSSIALTNDGRWIAVGRRQSGGDALIFDLRTSVQGRALGDGHGAKCVAFSQPDGRRLAVVRNRFCFQVDIWEQRNDDDSSYEKAHVVDVREDGSHYDDYCAEAADFSRDGTQVALLAGRWIHVLDFTTNRKWRNLLLRRRKMHCLVAAR